MSGTALVAGFGVTGRAVARALLADGERVVAIDDDPAEASVAAAADLGIELVSAPGPAELAGLVAGARLVVPSPGVAVHHPIYAAAARTGVPVCSEIELAWERLGRRKAPAPLLLAVTGTNGKTTVTTLARAMLEASQRRALSAGNIGRPLIEAVDADTDVIVAEVSSFQLQFTRRFRPAVSCWLNLAEDHLDWHPTMAHYVAAKARIWAAQGVGDVAVLNRDDAVVMATAGGPGTAVPGEVATRTFSVADLGADYRVDPAGTLRGPEGELAQLRQLPRTLPHDLANALAASAVALAAGASVAGCRAALEGFVGLPHRVELVAEDAGVRWYDDSKATTPASVAAAVAGFRSVVLIAGGRNKGLDLGSLRHTAPPVRAVVAIGEAAPAVTAAFAGVVPVVPAGTMEAAVEAAARLARPGDAVLLSPGCASFDWYGSYVERGDHFARAVRAHLRTPGTPVPDDSGGSR